MPWRKNVFTEPLNGVRKGFLTSERFRRGLRWACENFKDLMRVQMAYGERIREVTIDMCDPFKRFVREFFPNAKLTADKFHVLRLANPMINKARTEITGDQRSNPVRTLLLRNRHRLKYFEKSALDQWLNHHAKLKEIYWYKEALHQLYRTRGLRRASRALTSLTDQMALSKLPEIKKLRKTLMKWRAEGSPSMTGAVRESARMFLPQNILAKGPPNAPNQVGIYHWTARL